MRAKSTDEASASHHGVLRAVCATKVTARASKNVSGYQNGITVPRTLANVWAARICTASSRRLMRGWKNTATASSLPVNVPATTIAAISRGRMMSGLINSHEPSRLTTQTDRPVKRKVKFECAYDVLRRVGLLKCLVRPANEPNHIRTDDHWASHPPSTLSEVPVVNFAASEQR